MERHSIRSGHRDELDTLRDIERRAGAMFAEHDMLAIAQDEPPSVAVLTQYCDENRLWVAIDSKDQAIGYIIADVIDDNGHIEQVSVDPAYAGKRIGQALIQAVDKWAVEQGLRGLTLTTFSHIPWNAPYYRSLGFEEIPSNNLSPGLLNIRAQEREHGLDQWPRVCMQRRLDHPVDQL
ncbi:MAG: GNAT family N-acetyltransferase [Pseudomonadota bacterium]